MPTRRSAGNGVCEGAASNVKMALIISACLVAALGSFLVGDYLGLWKRTQVSRLEIIPIRFQAIDAVTGESVDNYHVRCSAPGSFNLCLPVAGAGAAGVKTYRIAGRRNFETGLLFSHDRGLVQEGPETIEIWVIHPDYRTHSQASSYAELVSLGSDMKEIVLTPKVTQ